MKFFEKIAFDTDWHSLSKDKKEYTSGVVWSRRKPTFGGEYLTKKYPKAHFTWSISQGNEPDSEIRSGTREDYKKWLKNTKLNKNMGSEGEFFAHMPSKQAPIEGLRSALRHHPSAKAKKFLGIRYKKGFDVDKASDKDIKEFVKQSNLTGKNNGTS